MLHALILVQGTLLPLVLSEFRMIDPAMDKMKTSFSHVPVLLRIFYTVFLCDRQPYEDGRREFSTMLENLNVAY